MDVLGFLVTFKRVGTAKLTSSKTVRCYGLGAKDSPGTAGTASKPSVSRNFSAKAVDCCASPCTRKTLRRPCVNGWIHSSRLAWSACPLKESSDWISALTRKGSPKILTSGSFRISFRPKRMLRLKACNQYAIARVFNIVAQMVQNSALFTHARSRDHHERAMQAI